MQPYPKQILTIKQQVQTYMDAGMKFASQTEVEQALQTIGYYRLRGYSFHLYDNTTKKYKDGTQFENILKLYEFDQKMSSIIFSMISKIEVTLRVRLVDALLTTQDALVLYDASVFKDKQLYWKNISSIASEIARSNDVFIKHNFDKHDGEIPVWAAVEVISFGTLSKIIKNLKTGTGSVSSVLLGYYKYTSKKGNYVTPSFKIFTSWIQAVSVLRNMCAHNARLYNRTIHTAPELIEVDKVNPAPAHNGLYQVLLAMKYLRPSDTVWNEFVKDLQRLLLERRDIIDLNAMNFPSDWEKHLCV